MKLIKEEYYRGSVREYFNKNLPDIPVLLTDGDPEVDTWVRIKFGDSDPGLVSETTISLYLCTAEDDDYMKLAGLVDRVTEYIQEGLYLP
jgi:hypothetical protein